MSVLPLEKDMFVAPVHSVFPVQLFTELFTFRHVHFSCDARIALTCGLKLKVVASA